MRLNFRLSTGRSRLRCPDFPPGLPSCEGLPSDHPACPPLEIIHRELLGSFSGHLLVLGESAGERFSGEGAWSRSDAGFEEALASKRQANFLHFANGLQEGPCDRGIAGLLAIPIRPPMYPRSH